MHYWVITIGRAPPQVGLVAIQANLEVKDVAFSFAGPHNGPPMSGGGMPSSVCALETPAIAPEGGQAGQRWWALSFVASWLLIVIVPIIFGDLRLDAPMYAWFSKRIAATGEWSSLYYDWEGNFAYFYKPPLMFWITAGLMKLFGQTEAVCRLVPAASFLLAGLLLQRLVRVIYGPVFAWTAASILVVQTIVPANVSEVRMDAPLIVGFIVAGMGILHVLRCAERQEPSALSSWALIGLGIGIGSLVRGGISLLVIPVLITALGGRRAWGELFRIRGWLVLLLVALPLIGIWPLWQTIKWSSAYWDAQYNQAVKSHIQARHSWSILLGYYPWRLVEGYALWLLPLAAGASVLWRNRRHLDALQFLTLVWIAVVAAAIHCTTSRAGRYMLPMYPWFAVIATVGIWSVSSRVRRFWLRFGPALVLVIAAAIGTGTCVQGVLHGKGAASVRAPELRRAAAIMLAENLQSRNEVPPERPAVWSDDLTHSQQRTCEILFATSLRTHDIASAAHWGGIQRGDYIVYYLDDGQRPKQKDPLPGLDLKELDRGQRMVIYRVAIQ